MTTKPTIADQLHLAADIEQSKLDGKPLEWQHRIAPESRWEDPQGLTPCDCLSGTSWEIRLKPAPRKVPLGPEDILPGSVLRHQSCAPHSFVSIMLTNRVGVKLGDDRVWTFAELQELGWLINSSLPLTGKWDSTAWKPCWKEVAE